MDSKTFDNEFLKFQDQLQSYLFRLSGNRQDAEDLAQETFLRAKNKIETFKGSSTFKTWIFAIATNLSRDHLRVKSRWLENYQDNCRTATYASQELRDIMADINTNSPAGKYELKEHVDFCFTCMAKTLTLEQQLVLILKEVYLFKVSEIISIMGSTEGKIKHTLADARKLMKEIFENRCSLVNKSGPCYQCTELNGILNPKQDARQKALNLEMVSKKDSLDQVQLLNLRLQLIQSINPLRAEGSDLHGYMMESLPKFSE